jgi:hypothetical protein
VKVDCQGLFDRFLLLAEIGSAECKRSPDHFHQVAQVSKINLEMVFALVFQRELDLALAERGLVDAIDELDHHFLVP